MQAEAQQRQMQERGAQAQRGMQGAPNPQQGGPVQAPHAHPQANQMVPNGIAAQPQRFHQQQVSQAQASSPIIRNGTPQSHSSPIVNNMGNVPMQHSTSSMGGSPPRPGSVVHQNHAQMGAPTAHGMSAQRSQQSHAGTPRMPNSTPNIQSTPLARQMTPRMAQGSPMQVQMPQQNMPVQMMGNGQVPMNVQQAEAMRQQQMRAAMMRNQQQHQAQQQQQQQAAAQGMGGMGGPQISPQQFLHAQMLRAQQQAAQQGNMQSGMQGAIPSTLAQTYAAQMSAMAQRSGGLPQNIPQNMMNNNPGMNGMQSVSMQQLQQMQMQNQMQQQARAQAQQQHAQAQAQQHAQAQAQQMQQNPQAAQQAQQQQMFQHQVLQQAQQLYMMQKNKILGNYPSGVLPEDVDRQLKAQCQASAHQQVQRNMQARRAAQQQQMMAAQQNGMHQQNMNGMQNGMGM